ncbi:MAG: hypothetical protein AMJ73_09935 [candidate division Zixibacteria bacterium SM1_73]|nr:MAG: hypothetical protein AMJ73_09935 [candidate division Zixibacteria bacterium SM1_73]
MAILYGEVEILKPHPLSPPLHKCGEGEIGGEVKKTGFPFLIQSEVNALANRFGKTLKCLPE